MLKQTAKILMYLIMVLFFLVLGVFLFHRFQLMRESSLLKTPIGQQVQVNGKKMTIYVKGKGKKTLVFLGGQGTDSPILDFKALYSKLTDDYRIVVVDRFGYGFSDDTKDSRILDHVLRDTRIALKEAKISGPYVLVPHSISGLEAIHWANKYPNEVTSIIGLDMTVPGFQATDLDEEYRFHQFERLAAALGFIRFPFFFNPKTLPALQSKALTKREEETYKAFIYQRTISDAFLSEVKETNNSINIVDKEAVPQIPTLQFVATKNEKESKESVEKRIQIAKKFAEKNPKNELVFLKGPHYIHDYKPKEIAQKIKEFLENNAQQ